MSIKEINEDLQKKYDRKEEINEVENKLYDCFEKDNLGGLYNLLNDKDYLRVLEKSVYYNKGGILRNCVGVTKSYDCVLMLYYFVMDYCEDKHKDEILDDCVGRCIMGFNCDDKQLNIKKKLIKFFINKGAKNFKKYMELDCNNGCYDYRFTRELKSYKFNGIFDIIIEEFKKKDERIKELENRNSDLHDEYTNKLKEVKEEVVDRVVSNFKTIMLGKKPNNFMIKTGHDARNF